LQKAAHRHGHQAAHRGVGDRRVWQAIRENERRVQILGLRPYTFKLLAFTAASFLAAMCGVAYLLLVGGTNPSIASAEFTLTLLVMVVLGGAGTRWGALIGGVLYSFLDQRLAGMAGSSLFSTLPSPLRVPLSQPLFILGLIVILVILFRPAGIASLFGSNGTSTHPLRRWRRWLGARRKHVRRTDQTTCEPTPPARSPVASHTIPTQAPGARHSFRCRLACRYPRQKAESSPLPMRRPGSATGIMGGRH